MYNIIECGVRGITLSTPDPDQGLVLNAQFENLIETEGMNRWPKGTDAKSTAEYTFSLNYGFKRVFAFDWLDYRGSAISDKTSSSELSSLKDSLERSFGIIVCVSGEDLITGENMNFNRKLVINRINLLITEIMGKRNGNLPKISIVITKADYIIGWKDDYVKERVSKLFNPFFVDGGNWDVSIFRVSLGKELASDNTNGEIKPVDVHLPILEFAKRFNDDLVEKAKSAKSAIQGRISELHGGAGFFENLFGYKEARTREITEKGKAADEVEALKSRLENVVKHLKDELKKDGKDKYLRFQNGRRVN
jgi:hypothetical protein